MQKTHCTVDAKHIRRFLNACEGNWHTCIYVNCAGCSKQSTCNTAGFLLHPDQNLIPCILPLSDAAVLFHELPDPEECICALNVRAFLSFYKAYLDRQDMDPFVCACVWMLQTQESENYDW